MALPDYKCSSVFFCLKTVVPKEIIFSLNLQCGSGLDKQKILKTEIALNENRSKTIKFPPSLEIESVM